MRSQDEIRKEARKETSRSQCTARGGERRYGEERGGMGRREEDDEEGERRERGGRWRGGMGRREEEYEVGERGKSRGGREEEDEERK